MKNYKIDLIINIISITIIMAAIIYLFTPDYKKEVKPESAEVIKEQPLSSSPAPTYNFNKMLNLIEESRSLEIKFHTKFYKFMNNYSNLNELSNVLINLKNERGKFKKYIKKTRKYYSRSTPEDKRNSLRYYFRVIENKIDTIKRMIETFNSKQNQNT